LQVSANIAHNETIRVGESLDVTARAEVIVDTVHLSGAWGAAVVENQWNERSRQVGVMPPQSLGQRSFAYTAWTREQYESGHLGPPLQSVTCCPNY
jgi:hypothetical protein